jgi:membrane-associated protein
MLHMAALDGQVASWFDGVGPILFYAIVWGLVFAGTGLFVGVFVPFITGDSLLFAAGILTAHSPGLTIWVLAIGVGIAAFLGDQVGFILGRHYGRPYLDRRKGPWIRRGVPPVAGIARMPYGRFLTANLVGALAWGVLLTVTGYFAASIPGVKVAAYIVGGGFIIAGLIAGLVAWRRNRVAARAA